MWQSKTSFFMLNMFILSWGHSVSSILSCEGERTLQRKGWAIRLGLWSWLHLSFGSYSYMVELLPLWYFFFPLTKAKYPCTDLNFLTKWQIRRWHLDLPCVLLLLRATPQLERVKGTLITLDVGIMFLQLQHLGGLQTPAYFIPNFTAAWKNQ